MEFSFWYLGLAAAFGLFMAWGIGANDVANAMATSVGAKALTIKQAILVAAIFEFTGAFLAGGQVTSTIRKGIIDASEISGNPELLIYGMLAALLAAGVWLLVASKNGWPVSSSRFLTASSMVRSYPHGGAGQLRMRLKTLRVTLTFSALAGWPVASGRSEALCTQSTLSRPSSALPWGPANTSMRPAASLQRAVTRGRSLLPLHPICASPQNRR